MSCDCGCEGDPVSAVEQLHGEVLDHEAATEREVRGVPGGSPAWDDAWDHHYEAYSEPNRRAIGHILDRHPEALGAAELDPPYPTGRAWDLIDHDIAQRRTRAGHHVWADVHHRTARYTPSSTEATV